MTWKTDSKVRLSNLINWSKFGNIQHLAEHYQCFVPTGGSRERKSLAGCQGGEEEEGVQVELELEGKGGFRGGEEGLSEGVSISSRWRTLEGEWSCTSSMQRGSGTTRGQVGYDFHSWICNSTPGHVSSTYVERLKGISLVVRSEVVTNPPPPPTATQTSQIKFTSPQTQQNRLFVTWLFIFIVCLRHYYR